MSDHLINTWHCNECEEIFYTDLEKDNPPSFCPYCGENYLSDSKVLVVKPIK